MRPGTGAAGFGAPAGARLGTGMRMAGAAGGAGIDVSIAERPVTQGGISGMRPVTSGPGRMVQDASYFVGVLRQKINEISAEIARMNADAEKAAADSKVLATYEKKYDSLIKEVRSLEGDLADYNLAMDKSRTSMDASEINYFFQQLKRRNDAASKEVDAVFMEKAEREKGVQRLEEQVRSSVIVAADRLRQTSLKVDARPSVLAPLPHRFDLPACAPADVRQCRSQSFSARQRRG